MEILFQSYTAYSRYIVLYNSLTSQEALAVVQSHPLSPPPPATPAHLPREKKMRLRERESYCTSLEAWEDGDKRYPGNEVDLEHNDYDVMCLDKMQHEKLQFYISLSFCFWVRRRFCFVFLVWGFVFPFRDLSICFRFWVFDFACMLFLGFCTSISRFWAFVLYYGHQGKLSVFYIVWFYFVFCDSGSCASALESMFLFSVPVFLFMYFPYRPPYVWPPFVCKSIH